MPCKSGLCLDCHYQSIRSVVFSCLILLRPEVILSILRVGVQDPLAGSSFYSLRSAASIGRLASRVAPGRHLLGFLLRSGSGRGVTLIGLVVCSRLCNGLLRNQVGYRASHGKGGVSISRLSPSAWSVLLLSTSRNFSLLTFVWTPKVAYL